MNAWSTVIQIDDPTLAGQARRSSMLMAQQGGLGEIAAANCGIIATELATNLARYSPGGRIYLQWLPTVAGGSLDIVSVDSGPGMLDLHACLRDGYSTGTTPGNGLGAVMRLASEFDIVSGPTGSIVFARVSNKPELATESHYRFGALSTPAPGEEVCGDLFRLAINEAYVAAMVIDGLGHGPLAQEAADSIGTAFEAQPFAAPAVLLDAANRSASGSRGAAAAAARLESIPSAISFAGIGNIAGSLVGDETGQGMMSHNGIVGARPRKPQQFEYQWGDKSILVMHSDGLQSRWKLDGYAGLKSKHPAIMAAVLMRDFGRGRDDATVLVIARRKP